MGNFSHISSGAVLGFLHSLLCETGEVCKGGVLVLGVTGKLEFPRSGAIVGVHELPREGADAGAHHRPAAWESALKKIKHPRRFQGTHRLRATAQSRSLSSLLWLTVASEHRFWLRRMEIREGALTQGRARAGAHRRPVLLTPLV